MRRTALFLLILLAGCGKTSPSGQAPPGEKQKPAEEQPANAAPVDVENAAALFWAYDGNLATADAKYTGKRVRFLIGPSATDKDGDHYVVGGSVTGQGAPVVRCHLLSSQNQRLAAFPGGPYGAIKVIGTCKGRFDDGKAFHGHYVRVDGCVIVSFLRWQPEKNAYVEEK